MIGGLQKYLVDNQINRALLMKPPSEVLNADGQIDFKGVDRFTRKTQIKESCIFEDEEKKGV